MIVSSIDTPIYVVENRENNYTTLVVVYGNVVLLFYVIINIWYNWLGNIFKYRFMIIFSNIHNLDRLYGSTIGTSLLAKTGVCSLQSKDSGNKPILHIHMKLRQNTKNYLYDDVHNIT